MKHTRMSLLAVMLLVALAVAACAPGGGGDTSAADMDAGMDGGVSVTAPGTFPIVEEKVSLRVLMVQHPLVEDFETNEFTKWYEEKTNVHIDWELVPSSGATEKLNLVLASGDLPDVIMDFTVSPAQQTIYGTQGLFLPLNDLIEEYGVETKKMFDASPNVRDLITAPDGNIYGMPHVNECYHCTLSQKLWINKIWLDNLGLEVPTTTEELYQVLKAFKEQDPNGNGIADEIPLAGAISGWNTNIDGFLMNPFIYSNHYNGNNYLTLENGQIDAAFNKPEWKDGLKFLRRLAEEGLLSDQTFTQDGGQLKQMGENPDVAILGAAPHGSMTGFTQAYGESERWLTYISVPALEGPTGNRVAAHDPFRVSSGRFIITSAAANPEVAFRWADGFYDRETTLRSVFGARLGEDWRWADDGEIGINGLPAIWNRGETFGQVNNFAWSQAGISYRPNELRLGEVADNPERNLEVLLYDASKENYEPYQRPFDQLIPPLFFDEAQSLELADMSVGINDYVKEMVARFVTGEADIDAEWDDYLATLDSLGLARYIEIHQEAFDAK